MKARIRGTNIEVDVKLFYDSGYFAGFKDGYEYYRPADLVFPDTPDWDKTDWESFRMEAARGILCAMIANGSDRDGSSYSEMAENAVFAANELIEQLKEEKQ